MSMFGGIIGIDNVEPESDLPMSGTMAPIPSLTAASSATAASGSGSPQHTVNKGVNPYLAIGAILMVAAVAFMVGRK